MEDAESGKQIKQDHRLQTGWESLKKRGMKMEGREVTDREVQTESECCSLPKLLLGVGVVAYFSS